MLTVTKSKHHDCIKTIIFSFVVIQKQSNDETFVK